jgi:hypothetical protein
MSEHTTDPANDRHQDVEVPGVEDDRATHTGHSRRIFLAGQERARSPLLPSRAR